MDCQSVRQELIGYHLASLDDEAAYRAIDAHLMGCAECLRGYLELKRSVERSPAPEAERPSERVRLRLRASVAARFRPRVASRAWQWMRRPFPLYQGLGVALLVLLIAALTPSLRRVLPWGAGAPRERALHGMVIDSALERAESSSIY